MALVYPRHSADNNILALLPLKALADMPCHCRHWGGAGIWGRHV